MDIHEWPLCIKSARRKKRLVKLDLDKQLIRLSKTREHLWQQQQDLPMVPLAQPISLEAQTCSRGIITRQSFFKSTFQRAIIKSELSQMETA